MNADFQGRGGPDDAGKNCLPGTELLDVNILFV